MLDRALGGWVKVRAWLSKDPKVLAMATHLSVDPDFLRWLAPGRGLLDAEDHVPRDAITAITVASLVIVWGITRDRGKPDGNDIIIPRATLQSLDALCGVDGFGAAMASVGWAVEEEDDQGHPIVRVPKYLTTNGVTPDVARARHAEAQRRYRDRKRATAAASRDVTVISRDNHGDVTVMSRDNHGDAREEKRREDIRETPPSPPSGGAVSIPSELDTEAFRKAWGNWKAERAQRRLKAYTPRGEATLLQRLAAYGPVAATAAIERSIANGWQGLFPEKEVNDGAGGRGTVGRPGRVSAPAGKYDQRGDDNWLFEAPAQDGR